MSVSANGAATAVRFVGFDSGGEVSLCGERVLRGIYRGHGEVCRQVLGICERATLFDHGIVRTREALPNPYPEIAYDLVLEHERVPFVSYPHEWSASMLKAAALLHIDLYIELGRHGLTIKDWHPYNILFDGPKPVFVDFTSIIPLDHLYREAYLTPPRVPGLFRPVWDKTSAYLFEMYRRMCLPYFLLPLYLMGSRRYERARSRLLESTLNAVGAAVISLDEVFAPGTSQRRRFEAKEILRRLALAERGPNKQRFLKRLRRDVEKIYLPTEASAYSSYYTQKGEEFGFEPSDKWSNKQRVVYETLKRLQPRTVLDAASNTGWFSILAAKHGCRVVAFDIDEASIDSLYRRASEERLPILPLVMDVTKLSPAVNAREFPDEPSLSLLGTSFPLLLAAEQRLECDLVMALAILHHLALGQGRAFGDVIEALAKLAKGHLLVEFVASDDAVVKDEPTFFPAYNANPREFGWYTLDNFVQELKKHFSRVEVKPSFPDTRSLILCEK